MTDWLQALSHRLESESAIVRVIVAATRGSVPREAGACMLVGHDKTEGTIGGGHLEWKAEAIARDMLANASMSNRRLDRFTLGATLGQCCGGVVELWFERFDASELDAVKALCQQRDAGEAEFLVTVLSDSKDQDASIHSPDSQLFRHSRAGGNPFSSPQKSLDSRLRGNDGGVRWLARKADLPAQVMHQLAIHTQHARILRVNDQVFLIENILPGITPLWLYGAGHVGRALVQVLADAPVRITWIDSRADLFPDTIPVNVTTRISEQPADEIVDTPGDAMHLIMTHRHDFDYAICRALLKHEHFQWAGMIGSETKAASFRGRLQREHFSAAEIARIVSPIGVPGIHSKLPAAIAISAAAQVLQVIDAANTNQQDQPRFKESDQ